MTVLSPLRLLRCCPLVLLIPAAGWAAAAAPVEGPDPREVPPPEIGTPLGRLPGVEELPVRAEMPDTLTMANGTPVRSIEQWRQRREEMKRLLEYYAVGQSPPPPGNVRGREVKAETVADGRVRYRLVHLTFGPGEQLSLDIGIFAPAEGGPFPAILLQGGTPPGAVPLPRLEPGPGQGRGLDALLPAEMLREQVAALDAARGARATGGRGGFGFGEPATADATAARHAEIFRRGYALVIYNANDCAEDTTLRRADGSWAFRHTRFPPAYPGYDWGILAVWAWGASRIADYLEGDPAIDRTRLFIITGASRNGKSAMIAAAFDERLLGAPVVTGGGGVGAYRFAGPRNSETLDVMQKKYPNWFSPHLHQFWGQRAKLPFDQHWFLALCAPRPFLALEGDTDTISLPEAVRQSVVHARPVYALYGVPDRLGVHYSRHGHAFTAEDWTALLNFADKHLLGKRDFTFDWFPTEADLDAAAQAAPGRGGRGRANPPAPGGGRKTSP